MRIRVEAEVRPTEDIEKVRKALSNLFNLESYRVAEVGTYKVIIGESSSITSLLKIREIIVRERIADTARRIFSRSAVDKYLSFKINKQAAYAGKLSFVEEDRESSMGPINVFIEAKDIKKLIDWLAPNTPEKIASEVPKDL
ncbi:MAG: RNA-binding domain-containing protein [Sulfolobales archaeon]